jgi:hypothetical protein
VDDQLQQANERFAGLVLRRHAFIAMQGSVPSAELYLKAQGGHFARPLAVGDGVAVPVGAMTMNFLIPRPDMPALPAAPTSNTSNVSASNTSKAAAPKAGGLIPRPPDIPTIAVTR